MLGHLYFTLSAINTYIPPYSTNYSFVNTFLMFRDRSMLFAYLGLPSPFGKKRRRDDIVTMSYLSLISTPLHLPLLIAVLFDNTHL